MTKILLIEAKSSEILAVFTRHLIRAKVSYMHFYGESMFKATIIALSCLIFSSHYAEPIQGRKYGVEFNIPRVLIYGKDWKSMSGTFSYFNHNNKTEIAFPWLIAKYGRGDEALLTKSIDIHYRKFLDDELNGFYLSGFARLSNFDGQTYSSGTHTVDTEFGTNQERNTEQLSKTRFGVGVGIGIRLFPKNKRMYWGTGLIIGRYLDDKEYNFVNEGSNSAPGPFADHTSVIIDVELLKFGYSF
ncbi:MAG TPA: hypothetical protein EYG71_05465 [Leucothrix sp.]|nr:hypothetical protein [Leucothrix sp.]